MTAVEHLEAVRNSLQAACKLPRGPLLSPHYAAGISDGIDVALRLIELEIQLAADLEVQS